MRKSEQVSSRYGDVKDLEIVIAQTTFRGGKGWLALSGILFIRPLPSASCSE
jgi:hypothetical protein